MPVRMPLGRPPLKNRKYAPATGVYTDFEKLLTNFVQTSSVRYETFAKLWREQKFSLIYAGRQSEREVKEFVEEAMKIAVQMCLPPYCFQARVGAIYILYGLYHTQPCVPRVQIRMTPEAWLHITSLKGDIVKQNHHDTNYIINKLLADGAFCFCAFASEFQSPARYSSDGSEYKTMADILREDRQSIDDLFPEEVLEQLNLLHTQYHQLKVRLAGPDAMRPDRSLDILQEKFLASIAEQLKKHHEQFQKNEAVQKGQKGKIAFENDQSSGGSGSDTSTQLSNMGRKRIRLRKLAFKGIKNRQDNKCRSLLIETSPPSQRKRASPKKRGRPRKEVTNTSNTKVLEPGQQSGEQPSKVAASSDSGIVDMPQLQEEGPISDGKETDNKIDSPETSSEITVTNEHLMQDKEKSKRKKIQKSKESDKLTSAKHLPSTKVQPAKKKVRMAHQVDLGILMKKKRGRPPKHTQV